MVEDTRNNSCLDFSLPSKRYTAKTPINPSAMIRRIIINENEEMSTFTACLRFLV
jgi:hypothetical protein